MPTSQKSRRNALTPCDRWQTRNPDPAGLRPRMSVGQRTPLLRSSGICCRPGGTAPDRGRCAHPGRGRGDRYALSRLLRSIRGCRPATAVSTAGEPAGRGTAGRTASPHCRGPRPSIGRPSHPPARAGSAARSCLCAGQRTSRLSIQCPFGRRHQPPGAHHPGQHQMDRGAWVHDYHLPRAQTDRATDIFKRARPAHSNAPE